MDILYSNCCGIDVHKKCVVACVLRPGLAGEPAKEIREFGTMTRDLLELADWLKQCGVTHVAMEATGVYWKPVWNILEGYAYTVLLVNAAHIKNVPGRKTDKIDCAWIAKCLRHGLLQPSFVPPAPIRELRDLCRTRSTLARQKADVANRIQKVLEDANIKLASVATDVLGVSGRDMLKHIIAGHGDAGELAELARGRLRNKLEDLQLALEGKVTGHHRFLLKEYLEQVEYLDRTIARFEQRIEEHISPFDESVALLVTIPGVERVAAWSLVAEIGANMEQFPSAEHLASWAGICPGNHESAGKRLSGKTRKGSPWLKAMLVQMAWAASHTKNTYLSAQYHRLAPRIGKKKALIAVAHSILTAAYHMLRNKQSYQDLGAGHFAKIQGNKAQIYHIRQLERLGLQVTVKPKAA